MKHTFLDHGSECTDPGNCLFCDCGLKLCTVCGLAEGSLTSECPGVKVDYELANKCYNGTADYFDDAWRIEETE
jgi:hypothetical protein